MSNRGVRGVRVVGPGSSRKSAPPADRPTDTEVDDRFEPVAPGDPPEDAAAAEASAISTIEAVGTEAAGTEAAGTEAAGTEAATQEQPEVAAAGTGPTPTGASSRRRWRMRLATTLAVLGLAGTIGFGYGYLHLNGQQNDVSAAKKQAQNYIIALTNFDPKGLDNEINKIQSYATGNFKTSISQFFSNDVRKSLLASNAASRGEVRSIYPQSNSGGRISFFAVVDDTIANNKLQAPASDQIDMTVDMVKTSQGWRVANNTFLQSPLFSPTQPGGESTPATTAPPKP